MKLLLMIDHFGSGGAQTQLVMLACGLKGRGHDISVFTYHRAHDFHRSQLEDAEITLFDAEYGAGLLGRTKTLAALLKREAFDGVISYLKTPNLLNTLVGTLRRQKRVVVSERSSRFNDQNPTVERFRRELHRFADCVVTNSPDHATWLRQTFAHLKNKVTVILNGYVVPPLPLTPSIDSPKDLRLIAVGRITSLKQADLLIKALTIVNHRRGFIPATTWVGRRDPVGPDHMHAQALDALLADQPYIASRWTWAGERRDGAELIAEHHVLVHPALHEGFANVLCEALILGRPILAGTVCDHKLLTGAGSRGGLFDVRSPKELADQIERFMDLSTHDYTVLCKNARTFAIENLSIERLVTEYETLLVDL